MPSGADKCRVLAALPAQRFAHSSSATVPMVSHGTLVSQLLEMKLSISLKFCIRFCAEIRRNVLDAAKCGTQNSVRLYKSRFCLFLDFIHGSVRKKESRFREGHIFLAFSERCAFRFSKMLSEYFRKKFVTLADCEL